MGTECLIARCQDSIVYFFGARQDIIVQAILFYLNLLQLTADV
jgi:hypothetical protein